MKDELADAKADRTKAIDLMSKAVEETLQLRERVKVVEITVENQPRCFWHSNCVVGQGNGIMKVIRNEPDKTIFECQHCGQCGYFPIGHPFGKFCSPQVPKWPDEHSELTTLREQVRKASMTYRRPSDEGQTR